MAFTLSRYIGRNFYINILIAFAIILAIAGLIDLIELIRRTSDKPGATLLIVLRMAALRLPHLAEKLLPYSVVIGGMMALMKMTRSHELVVARAAGVSVWRFLMPGLGVALILGLISIAILNPLSAATMSRYATYESRYIHGSQHVLSISSSGLWLRQGDAGHATLGNTAIHSYVMQAASLSQDDMGLRSVIIFLQDEYERVIGRIDAEYAQLREGYWEMQRTIISAPGDIPMHRERYVLPTDLSIRQIQDSFAEPHTLSFWELSGFITTLQKAGFSAIRHKLHWVSILLTPLACCSMLLLASVFSLRLPRRGRSALMIIGAITAGFTVNFITGLFHAFGYAGTLPIIVAAIAPYAITIMASIALLLHLEDG